MNEAQPPRTPPRFVPVLTEVVHSDAPAPSPPPAGPARTAPLVDVLEEQLVHRVMQRVDVSLERHLDDAVAAVVLQHTHALVPRLREEIEFIVRQAVAEAVAAELAQRPAPGP
ncbi:hypothetical protein [Pseudorhodoferax sp. Leaf267]|uniref:hypothetical protein n=1 Tax=Pseudorhodoferax sp. Leaf267 TaxID=1736316 RepID=UPI0006F58A27|nr:hypothetical protein [Pseudorhodoferax sp. Leaf267]KQP15059.1 hypothetical protein ASF43_13550 [Pseudorhodoferax sp. Leaf267]